MSNDLTVTLHGSNGQEQFPISRFVNGQRVAADLVMPPPEGFKRVPQVVKVDVRDMRQGGDVYNVGGGKVGISGRVYSKLRAQAGINVIKTTVEPVTLDGKPGVQVSVWGVRQRPGRPTLPICKTVAATYEDALARAGKTPEADVRMFLPRKLETAALNRLTRDMLGEPTTYTKQELDEGQGCLLVVADVPDPADPRVRDIMVRQALGAGADLYGLPQQSALPPAAPIEALEDHELDIPPAGESRGEGLADNPGSGAGNPPRQQQGPTPTASPASSDEADWEDLLDEPAPRVQAWCSAVPKDPKTGEVLFRVLDAAALRGLLKDGAVELSYPKDDPANVLGLWKQGKHSDAALALWTWGEKR